MIRNHLTWLMTIACAASALAGPLEGPEPAAPAGGRNDAPAARGARTYGHYCVVCHGADADGNGRAAAVHNPRPANLRATDKTDAYIGRIVRQGGAALGRSPGMPPWGNELSDQQVEDIVAFIRSINNRP